jgi:predicted RNA binding protein YcfA (HicA-like mRNA interferase family)
MGKLPGINHLNAVKAFERAGFEIIRQSGHIVMSDGRLTIVIPRNNPVNAITMFRIIRDSGLTLEQFRKLL